MKKHVRNLPVLLEEAKKEGVRNIHVLADIYRLMETIRGGFYETDVYLTVRYWKGKDMREAGNIRRYVFKKINYDLTHEFDVIREQIESRGLRLMTIRERKHRKPKGYEQKVRIL